MNCPPALVHVRVHGGPGLWLPLFLLWPVIFVLCAPLLLLAGLLLSSAPLRPQVVPIGRELWRVMCSLRGLRVDLRQAATDLSFSLY